LADPVADVAVVRSAGSAARSVRVAVAAAMAAAVVPVVTRLAVATAAGTVSVRRVPAARRSAAQLPCGGAVAAAR
jgi:hypothetical protein